MIDDGSLDWDHNQNPEHKEIALRIAGLSAEKHLDDNENLKSVKADFLEEYGRLVDSGEVWSKPRKVLAAEAAWSQANASGRKLGTRLILDLADGITWLPDLQLQLPHLVVVGRNRRVSARTLTSLDIEIMDLVRIDDAQSKVKSADKFSQAARIVAPTIAKYGDLGTAIRSGAFGSEATA